MMLNIDIEARVGTLDLSMRFASTGRVTALFGRSGAGKTSLVSMIAGLARPLRGKVEVDGLVLFDSTRGIDVPAHERRTGYVFQEGRLFPHLSVRQNLLYSRLFLPRKQHRTSLEHIVELLDLGQLLDRRPGALSGGEKQRVAIGRALLAEPRVLLLDEPLASLDGARKEEILRYVERMRDDVRIPVVYVSHAVEEVLRLADTVVLVADGRVVTTGSVGEVMGRPDLRALAGTFEGGSVIETRVVEVDASDETSRLAFEGGELTVPGCDLVTGESVRVRIRARDVSIAITRPENISISNILAGRVIKVSASHDGVVDVTLDIGGGHLRARITARSATRLGLRPGGEAFALIKAISLDRHRPSVAVGVSDSE